jgi:hypothetical protein
MYADLMHMIAFRACTKKSACYPGHHDFMSSRWIGWTVMIRYATSPGFEVGRRWNTMVCLLCVSECLLAVNAAR